MGGRSVLVKYVMYHVTYSVYYGTPLIPHVKVYKM